MVAGDSAPFPSAEGVRVLADLCQRAGVYELEASAGAWSVHLQIDFEAAAAVPARAEQRADVEQLSAPYVLRSAWVGVFRRALDPDSTPLAQEGAVVRDGDVVGLIEAMQLLHEQPADRDGTIVRFLVDDGAPVEYGQPLLEIG